MYSGTIAWSDICHVFIASAHYPADCFQAALRKMDAAWAETFEDRSKESINSLIGLWCLDEAWSLKLRSSTCPDDAPSGEVMKRYTFRWGGA